MEIWDRVLQFSAETSLQLIGFRRSRPGDDGFLFAPRLFNDKGEPSGEDFTKSTNFGAEEVPFGELLIAEEVIKSAGKGLSS